MPLLSRQLASSGDYRCGFSYCVVRGVAAGKYTILASCFEAAALGQFTVVVGASRSPIRLAPCTAASDGLTSKVRASTLGVTSACTCAFLSKYACACSVSVSVFFSVIAWSAVTRGVVTRGHCCGMASQVQVAGEWLESTGTAAGCVNHGNYDKNPKLLLTVPRECSMALALHGGVSSTPHMNLSVFQCPSTGQCSTRCAVYWVTS